MTPMKLNHHTRVSILVIIVATRGARTTATAMPPPVPRCAPRCALTSAAMARPPLRASKNFLLLRNLLKQLN